MHRHDLTPEQFIELFKIEPGPYNVQALINELCNVYGSNTLTHSDHQILIEYSEPYYLDVGYFYCPNVPAIHNKPVVLDPNEYNAKKGIMTRYGKKLLEEGAKLYSKIKITDFKI